MADKSDILTAKTKSTISLSVYLFSLVIAAAVLICTALALAGIFPLFPFLILCLVGESLGLMANFAELIKKPQLKHFTLLLSIFAIILSALALANVLSPIVAVAFFIAHFVYAIIEMVISNIRTFNNEEVQSQQMRELHSDVTTLQAKANALTEDMQRFLLSPPPAEDREIQKAHLNARAEQLHRDALSLAQRGKGLGLGHMLPQLPALGLANQNIQYPAPVPPPLPGGYHSP